MVSIPVMNLNFAALLLVIPNAHRPASCCLFSSVSNNNSVITLAELAYVNDRTTVAFHCAPDTMKSRSGRTCQTANSADNGLHRYSPSLLSQLEVRRWASLLSYLVDPGASWVPGCLVKPRLETGAYVRQLSGKSAILFPLHVSLQLETMLTNLDASDPSSPQQAFSRTSDLERLGGHEGTSFANLGLLSCARIPNVNSATMNRRKLSCAQNGNGNAQVRKFLPGSPTE